MIVFTINFGLGPVLPITMRDIVEMLPVGFNCVYDSVCKISILNIEGLAKIYPGPLDTDTASINHTVCGINSAYHISCNCRAPDTWGGQVIYRYPGNNTTNNNCLICISQPNHANGVGNYIM